MTCMTCDLLAVAVEWETPMRRLAGIMLPRFTEWGITDDMGLNLVNSMLSGHVNARRHIQRWPFPGDC